MATSQESIEQRLRTELRNWRKMVIELKPCQFCGKPYKNVRVHEKYCNMKLINEKRAEPTPIIIKRSFIERILGIFRQKSKPERIEVRSPEDLIEGLKPYQIPQTNPKSGLGKLLNKDKDFIQVVLVSEIIEPKTFWAEKTGLNIIQYKDRMYKLPRDIKGSVFFWHIDKKEPLIDSAHANQSDAESSFHNFQLFNMAYAVGRAAGANDLMNNLKLILIMVGIVLFLIVVDLYYLNTVQKGLNANDEYIINTLNYINQTTPRNY